MKAHIVGIIKCRCKENIEKCLKILNAYNICYDVKDETIDVNGMIKITPWFENAEFTSHLRRKLSAFSECKINVETVY